MSQRVLVLGAGFGGLELTTLLAEAPGDDFEVTLIDKNDSFVFGFSKLDVMFGRTSAGSVKHHYADIAKPGVTVLQETITRIDPATKTVTTDKGTHEADILVVALGADYETIDTPGINLGENEFYSVAGAAKMAEVLPTFKKGHAVIGVCDAPFKCPPAPSECALMLHDYLTKQGVRDRCEITFVMALGTPVPPSPAASKALLEAFEERNINFIGGTRVKGVTADKVLLDDDTALPYDLFLGVPKHRAPDVVQDSGLAEGGYIPVDSADLKTKFDGVYAVGDCATAGVPKAGVFAEGAAKVVAAALIADAQAGKEPIEHKGQGSCYIEFGDGLVGRVDIDFLSGPNKTGDLQAPSVKFAAEKDEFGSSRRARWFDA